MLKVEQEPAVFSVSKMELWVIRTGGALIITALGWIGVQFQQALIHVAEIRKELEIVKPVDILRAVTALEKHTLTEHDVKRILQENSVWVEEKGKWEEWRYEVTEKTKDRFTATEFKHWKNRLKDLNPDLNVPE